MKPLVSIIIPTYNRAYLIGETLESILLQTYTNWECLVIDDGVTDNTKEIVADYIKNDNRFQYHVRPDHLPKGANACRNYGFKKSKGAYIKWFDSDDIMLPNMLETQINEMEKNMEYEVTFCESKSFTMQNGTKSIIDYFKIEYQNFIEDYVLRKLLIQTGSGLWKREFIKQLSFDEQLTQSQDYDFCSRAFILNPKVSIVNEPLYLLRRENDSITKEYESHNIGHLKSYLRVKLKILNLYKEDDRIEKGIINHVLSSLNLALGKKNTQAVSVHLKMLNGYFKEHKNSSYSARWRRIKMLSKLISVVGKGAFRFRSSFVIK